MLTCDNHPDQQAVYLVTNIENGDVLTCCGECFTELCVSVVQAVGAAMADAEDGSVGQYLEVATPPYVLDPATEEIEQAEGAADVLTGRAPFPDQSETHTKEVAGDETTSERKRGTRSHARAADEAR